MCKHLRMEPFGDPEARIRDLERPLADRARASELGTGPSEGVSPPTVPVPPQHHGPPSQPYGSPSQPYGSPRQPYGSPYYAPPQRVVRKPSHTVATWLVPIAVVTVLVVGVAGAVMFLNFGEQPVPRPAAPTAGRGEPPVVGGGGPLEGPPRVGVDSPVDSTEKVVTVQAGGSVSLGGVSTERIVFCDGGAVNISGMRNDVRVQGACTSVIVSGIENTVTLDSADIISASGVDNRVSYRSGNPETSTSGFGNIIEPD
ncbi:DUF3060 domain-containing protein [Mycobacterium sp. smrl_JER01]